MTTPPGSDAKGKRKPKEAKPKSEPVSAGAWPRGEAWWLELRVNDQGIPKGTLGNAALFLEHEATLRGRLAWNEMSASVELDAHALGDADVTEIRVHLERAFYVTFAEVDLVRAAELIAHKAPYHPVRRYLAGLVWDGTVRIPWVLEHVLHAEVSPLHETYLRKFLISAVARALKPGCKVDTVLVLKGEQGTKKSSFFQALASPWFTDSEMDLGSKDAYLMLGASWIVEWGELNTLNKSTQERAKAFLSSREDIFRAPYARSMTRRPRTAVIVGSTNEDVFLKDETGSRRFWILPVSGNVALEELRAARDQIWAEAKVLHDQGEEWWLTHEEDGERAELAERYEGQDVWTPTILEWATGRDSFTTAQVLNFLTIPSAQQKRGEEMRAAAILKRAGFRKERHQEGNRRQYLWRRPASLPGFDPAQPDITDPRLGGRLATPPPRVFGSKPNLSNLPNLVSHIQRSDEMMDQIQFVKRVMFGHWLGTLGEAALSNHVAMLRRSGRRSWLGKRLGGGRGLGGWGFATRSLPRTLRSPPRARGVTSNPQRGDS